MNIGTLDLSYLPPAIAWVMVVIVLVCHVLPDVISFEKTRTISLPSSTAGTSSPVSSTTTSSSVSSSS
jgi:hypothetical protein